MMRNIYYGWWILTALTVAGVMAYGSGLYAFTLFVKPLASEFGWSRAVTGGSVSIFWLSAPLVIFIGRWVDIHGARKLLILGAIIEGVCLMLISQIDSVWQLYTLRAAMGVGKILIATPIPVVIALWFNRYQGLATGVGFAGWHLGGLVTVAPTQYLLLEYGWRNTSIMMGLFIMLVVIPPVVILLKYRKPADCGALPDGDSVAKGVSDGPATVVNPDESIKGASIAQVVRSASFWIIVAITVIYYFGYSSILTHMVAFLTDMGLSDGSAANLLSLTAGLAIVGVISFGFACDRSYWATLLAYLFLMLIVAAAILLFLTQPPLLWVVVLAMVIFGVMVGAGDVIWVTTLTSIFGKREFGAIFGLWYFFMLATMTVSPFIAGYIYDASRSYSGAFIAVIASGLIALGGAWWLHRTAGQKVY